ncbi:MAG: 3-oxoacyl-[acyl-carrier-protein] reductase [Acidobacteriia bacterium]|nr:3-oxoacyl-[acyl-carrier-protein] reductase [Terriglobia bacterium]
MLLENKIAVVTGASQGIGRATALVLAEAGATVAVLARQVDKLNSLRAEIEALGRRAVVIQCDVSLGDDIKRAFEQVVKELTRVDILVNNAGITRDGLLMRMKTEDWDAVLATNLTSVFRTTQEALKLMVRQRYGRIINITSIVAQSGNAGQANYVAAKAGVIGFTKAIAQEVASRQITVNAVAPGFVDTAMTAGLPEAVKQKLLEMIPLKRMGTDREIACAVKFLASDEAAYITGQVLGVNGGMYM